MYVVRRLGPSIALAALLGACGPSDDVGELSIHFSPAEPSTLDDVAILIRSDRPVDNLTFLAERGGLRADFTYGELDPRSLADGGVVASLTLPAQDTTRRQQWRFRARALYGKTWVEDTARLAFANSQPELQVTLEPADPDTTEPIRAVVNASDPDDDPITVSYNWWVDGQVAAVNGSTLPASATHRDATVRVQVIAQDGDLYAEPALAFARVANAPPTAPTVSLGPGAYAGGRLICALKAPATHADEIPLDYAVRWRRDGEPWSGALATHTILGDTIPAGITRADEQWACSMRAFDGQDWGPEHTSELTLLPWAGARRFTTCGAHGPYGPTDLACADDYADTPLDGEVRVEDGIQIWRVPADGLYRIEARGAEGGNSDHSQGGRGARIASTFLLEAGDELHIAVGQAGLSNTINQSSGGGGGTFIVRDGRPLTVAGGGGGAGSYYAGCHARAEQGGTRVFHTCEPLSRDFGHGGHADDYHSSSGGAGFFESGETSRHGLGEGGRSWAQGLTGGRTLTGACGTSAGGFGGGGSGDVGPRHDGCAADTGAGGGGGGYSGGGAAYFGGGAGSHTTGDRPERESAENQGPGAVIIDLD